MSKGLLAITGVVFIFLVVSYQAYLNWLFENKDIRQFRTTLYTTTDSAVCNIAAEVVPKHNVISISDSISVVAKLSNSGRYELDEFDKFMFGENTVEYIDEHFGNCDKLIKVDLYAPSFLLDPREGVHQVQIPLGRDSAEVSWVITPTKMGRHSVVVHVGGGHKSEEEILVTNNLGIPVAYTEIISIIIAFMGPALTFPWLYEKWNIRKSKKKKSDKKIIIP